MNSTPNRKPTEPDNFLIVRADELARAYQQITRADDQQIARAGEQPAHVTKYTSNPKATEMDDGPIARTDEGLGHAYEQIARVDEQLARVTEQLSRLARNSHTG
jgi:ubiquinone biosynthesis protein UbiJ